MTNNKFAKFIATVIAIFLLSFVGIVAFVYAILTTSIDDLKKLENKL